MCNFADLLCVCVVSVKMLLIACNQDLVFTDKSSPVDGHVFKMHTLDQGGHLLNLKKLQLFVKANRKRNVFLGVKLN